MAVANLFPDLPDGEHRRDDDRIVIWHGYEGRRLAVIDYGYYSASQAAMRRAWVALVVNQMGND